MIKIQSAQQQKMSTAVSSGRCQIAPQIGRLFPVASALIKPDVYTTNSFALFSLNGRKKNLHRCRRRRQREDESEPSTWMWKFVLREDEDRGRFSIWKIDSMFGWYLVLMFWCHMCESALWDDGSNNKSLVGIFQGRGFSEDLILCGNWTSLSSACSVQAD